MFEYLRPTDSLSWTIAWQSSLLLAIGLAASVAYRRRPARAHRALLTAMLAALVAPSLTEAGRRLGWGFWSAPEAVRIESPSVPDIRRVSSIPPSSPVPLVPPPLERSRPTIARTSPAPAETVAPPHVSAPFPWGSAFLAAWAIASLALAARLLLSYVRGLRLVCRGRAVDDPAIRAPVDRAAGVLGLRVGPEVRRLAAVRCPAIWCWGRRPVLLLPEGEDTQADSIDWNGVFCHELAHWSRRDHLSALAGEILVCALPWNPLAWWSRLRLADLAELACDDWVLAAGLPAADYAESLLGLAPQRQATPALAAVSSRRGLMNRLRHILAEGRRDPSPGARWTLAVCLTTLAAVSALALAQSRPASARQAATPKDKQDQALNETLRGTVLGPDDKPLAGATVLWVGNRKPPLSYVALPRGDRNSQAKIETIAKAQSGADGTFELSAPFDPADYAQQGHLSSQVVVVAQGYGLTAEPLQVKHLSDPLNLKVPEQVVIHGRLLTPGGMPAPGVQATMGGFINDTMDKGMFFGNGDERDDLPEYWPRTQTTDADGHFTIEGAPVGMYVTIAFQHPDYAVDEVTVNTIPERTLSPGIRGFEIVPVEPTFTHTLEPARPVQGRVTDKETGKPLADMLVEMIPMRRHGGQTFSTRTDADGRYRVSGHSTDGTYFTTVYPRADSGYLSSKEVQNGWPAGAKALEVNFALEKGRLIPGRVVDQDTKQPIAGAAVVYQPARKNPNNTGDYDLRNTVVTDADGRFTITGLAGEGALAVETASDVYIRTPVKLSTRQEMMHPQGYAAVDIPKEGEPKPVEIAVRKGVLLEARIVDTDGRPVDDVTAMYLGIDAALIDVWNQGREFADGLFRIPGADPERTYRVYFIKPEARLGTVAELKYNPTGKPLKVRLQPTATIVGRLGAPGDPPQGARAHVSMLLKKEKKEYTRDELFNENNAQFYANIIGQRNYYLHDGQPNDKGEFRFEAIIPGVGYYVSGGGGSREFRAPVWDLKPGEVRDLGTLELEERPR